MTNITEIISSAAKAYAKNSTASDKETPDWIERDFKAGVEFATSDPSVLKELLGKFVDWMEQEYQSATDPRWALTKYIQFITDNKQKEDEAGNNS